MRKLPENKTRDQTIAAPVGLVSPMKIEPRDKLALGGFRPTGFRDGAEIAFRSLVTKPLVPMAADPVERTAQKRSATEAFLAPVPECPKPDEAHGALRRQRTETQPPSLSERRIKRKGIRSVTFSGSQPCASSSDSSASMRYSPSNEKMAVADNKGRSGLSETNVTSKLS